MKKCLMAVILLLSLPSMSQMKIDISAKKGTAKSKAPKKSILKNESKKPNTPEKTSPKKEESPDDRSTKVKFNEQVEEYHFDSNESPEGQVQNLPQAPNLENYVQNKLSSGDSSQQTLDNFAVFIMNQQEELANEKVPPTTRLQIFGEVLVNLARIFQEIIPQKTWDVYQIKKYSLLADQYNKLLKAPRNAQNVFEGMIDDFYAISSEVIEYASDYLKKNKESKNVAKAHNGKAKK